MDAVVVIGGDCPELDAAQVAFAMNAGGLLGLFADVILPACTALERDDIAEWGEPGGLW